MKKIIKVVLIVLVVIILTTVLSLKFFKYFNVKTPALIANVKMTVESNNQKLEDGKTALQYYNSYSFKLENNNDVDVNYKLLINDNSNDTNGIARQYINYVLYLNGKIVHSGELSDLQNDVLDKRIIEPNMVNQYKLEVWTNEYDVNNKTYQYEIKLEENKD